jgi:hypothetical protein
MKPIGRVGKTRRSAFFCLVGDYRDMAWVILEIKPSAKWGIRMNLADMLCYADIEQLSRIARTYNCADQTHSKNELIQSILSAIYRRSEMENRIDQMNSEDMRLLNTLLFENRTAYSLEELRAKAAGTAAAGSLTGLSENGMPPAPSVQVADDLSLETDARGGAPKAKTGKRGKRQAKSAYSAETRTKPESPADRARQSINKFKQYGWLFNGFSQQTRNLYQVPDDIKRSLRETLERRYKPLLVEREEPPVYRDEHTLLLDDLATFVRYVRDHDVLLALDGTIYKRQLGQLLALMSVYEEVPDKSAGWRFGYGRKFRDFPDRFSFLYDFACHKGLVFEQPDRLVVTEAGREVAAGAMPFEIGDMYRYWLRLYRGPIPNISVLAQWVCRLCRHWTTADSLFGVLKPLIRPYFFDSERDILDKRVLAMLMHLGLIRSGATQRDELVIQTSTLGKRIVTG